ncbi:transcriptional regulator GutM [Tessaracoccus sp. G1721]
MFWILIIALGLAWIVQSVLSFKQTQAFTKLFVALRRRGRVAMGKFRGGLVQGAIVMFVIDDDGVITEGQRLHGVTVLARFRAFDEFTGSHIADVDPALASPWGRSMVKAVANARDNYRIITGGGTAPEPPTALTRALGRVSAVASRLRRRPAPIAG